MPYAFFGQADGPRVLRYGEGYRLVQSDGSSVTYKSRVELWDLAPAGPMGNVVFRSIDVKLRHTLGYSVAIIPIVDGIEEQTQVFSAGPPAGGLLEEYVELQAVFPKAGNQIAAIVELDSTYSVQDVAQVQASGFQLRRLL